MATGFFAKHKAWYWIPARLGVNWLRSIRRGFGLFWLYILNRWISHIPLYWVRHSAYPLSGIKLEAGASIKMGAWIEGFHITIGHNSTVSRNALLDGRDQLTIGNNVSISPDVQLITGSHDINSHDFAPSSAPIVISDFVWICSRSIVLPGVTIGEGAVMAAGAVVTKNVEPFTVVGRVSAAKLTDRSRTLNYQLHWRPLFS